jgi:hypothetical protein
MLNKVEFSDLYKFLTSVGLIIMASAVLIPWLFMKQEIGLLISETEYNGLIESSKNLTDRRIQLGLIITKAIPYISGILFALGILISGIGLWNWKKKQDTVDETDLLKLTELKAKIKELDSDEIDEKAEQEVRQEIQAEIDKTEKKDKPAVTEENIEELKANLIDMEKFFYDKIVNFNSFNYNVKSNVKIDNKYEVDIALTPLNKKYRDSFIEIKYLQSKLTLTVVQDAFRNLNKVHGHFFNTTKKYANKILIIVYKSDIADAEEIKRFKVGIQNYFEQFKPTYFKYYVLNEEEARNFNIQAIVQ